MKSVSKSALFFVNVNFRDLDFQYFRDPYSFIIIVVSWASKLDGILTI